MALGPPTNIPEEGVPQEKERDLTLFLQQAGISPAPTDTPERDLTPFLKQAGIGVDAVKDQRNLRQVEITDLPEPPPIQLAPDPNMSGESRQVLESASDMQPPPRAPEAPSPYAQPYKEFRADVLGEGKPDALSLDRSARETPLPNPKVTGAKIADSAEQWVGKVWKPGRTNQCANWVRHIIGKCGVPLGVSEDPLDAEQTRNLGQGPSFANSFFGEDVGTIIHDVTKLRPGDVVGFFNTVGDYLPGTLTHAGVYVGDGQVVDRPTKDKPVSKRNIADFPHGAVGVRPYAYAGEPPDTERALKVAPQTLRLRSRALGIKEGMNPSLLNRVFEVESNYNPYIESDQGELGLGQTMWDTVQETLTRMGKGAITKEEFLEDPTLQMNVSADILKTLGSEGITANRWPRVIAGYKAGMQGLEQILQNPESLDNKYASVRDYVAEIFLVSPEEAKKLILDPKYKGPQDRLYSEPPDFTDPYTFTIRPRTERFADSTIDDDEELPDYYLPTNYYSYHFGRVGGRFGTEALKDPVGQIKAQGKAAKSAFFDFFSMIEARAIGMQYGFSWDQTLEENRKRLKRLETLGLKDNRELEKLKFARDASEDMKFRIKRTLSAVLGGSTQWAKEFLITEREQRKHQYKTHGAVSAPAERVTKGKHKGKWKATVDLGWDEDLQAPKEETRLFPDKHRANAWIDQMKTSHPGAKPVPIEADSRIGRFPKITGRGGWLESITLNPVHEKTPTGALLRWATGKELESLKGGPEAFLPTLGGGDIYDPTEWGGVLGNTAWQIFNNADSLLGYVAGLHLAGKAARGIGAATGFSTVAAKFLSHPKIAGTRIGAILADMSLRYELGFASQAFVETFNHTMSDKWYHGNQGFKESLAEALSAASTNSSYSLFMGLSMMGGSYFGGSMMTRFADNFIDASEEARKKAIRGAAERSSKDWHRYTPEERDYITKKYLKEIEAIPPKVILGLEKWMKGSIEAYVEAQELKKTVAFRLSQSKSHAASAAELSQVRRSLDDLIETTRSEVDGIDAQLGMDHKELRQLALRNPDVKRLVSRYRRAVQAEWTAKRELQSYTNSIKELSKNNPDQIMNQRKEIVTRVKDLQKRVDDASSDLNNVIDATDVSYGDVQEFARLQKRISHNTKQLSEMSSPGSAHNLSLASLYKTRNTVKIFEEQQTNLSRHYKDKSRISPGDVSFNEQGLPDIRPQHYQIAEEFSGKLIDDLVDAGGMSRDQAENLMSGYVSLVDSWTEAFEATSPAALETITHAYLRQALGGDALSTAKTSLRNAEDLISTFDEPIQKSLGINLEPLKNFIERGDGSFDIAMDNFTSTMDAVVTRWNDLARIGSKQNPGNTPKMSAAEARVRSMESLRGLYASLGNEQAAQLIDIQIPKDAFTAQPRIVTTTEEAALASEFIGNKRAGEAMLRDMENHTGALDADGVIGATSNVLRNFTSRSEDAATISGYTQQVAEENLKSAFANSDFPPKGPSVAKWNWHTHPVLRELSNALDIDDISNIGIFVQRNPEFRPLLSTLLQYRNWADSAGVSQAGSSMVRLNMMPDMFPRLRKYMSRKEFKADRGASHTVPSGQRTPRAMSLLRRISEKKRNLSFDLAEEKGRQALNIINSYRAQGNRRKFQEKHWEAFVMADDTGRLEVLGLSDTPTNRSLARDLADDLLLGQVDRNATNLVRSYVANSLNADNQMGVIKSLMSLTDVVTNTPFATFAGERAIGQVGKRSVFSKSPQFKEAKKKTPKGEPVTAEYIRLGDEGISGFSITDPVTGASKDIGDLWVHPQAWGTIQDHMVVFSPGMLDNAQSKLRNTMLSGVPFPFLSQQFGQVYKSTNLNMAKSLGIFEMGSNVRKGYNDLVSDMVRNGLNLQDYLQNVFAFKKSAMHQDIALARNDLLEAAAKDMDVPRSTGRTLRQSFEEFFKGAQAWHADSPWWSRAATRTGEILTSPLENLLRLDHHLNDMTTFSAVRDAQVGAVIFHTNRLWKKHGGSLLSKGKNFDEAYREVQRAAIDLTNQQSGSLPTWWVSSEARRNMFRMALTPQWTLSRVTAWGGWLDEELFGGKALGRFRHLSPEMREAMRSEYRWMAINGVIGALTWANALSYMVNGTSTVNNPNGRVFDVMAGDYMLPNPFFGHDRQILDIFLGPAVQFLGGADEDRMKGHVRRSLRRIFALSSPGIGALAGATGLYGRHGIDPDREIPSSIELGMAGGLQNVGAFTDTAQTDPYTGGYKSPLVRGAGAFGAFPVQIRPESIVDWAQTSENSKHQNLRKRIAITLNQAASYIGKNPQEVSNLVKEALTMQEKGMEASKELIQYLTTNDDDKKKLYSDGRVRLSDRQLKNIVESVIDPEMKGAEKKKRALRDEIARFINQRIEAKKRAKKLPAPVKSIIQRLTK